MDLENKSDAEILTIADPIMDNLMEASTAIDHARHVRDFTDRLKAIVTKDYLERVCRQYQTEKGYVRRAEAGRRFSPARLHRHCAEETIYRRARRLCC